MKATTKTKTTHKNSVKATSSNAAEAVLTGAFKEDLKTSVLVVSVLVNLFVLTAYMVLQSTNAYDQQMVSFLFAR